MRSYGLRDGLARAGFKVSGIVPSGGDVKADRNRQMEGETGVYVLIRQDVNEVALYSSSGGFS